MTRAFALLTSAAVALSLTAVQPAAAHDRTGQVVAGAIVGLAAGAILGSTLAHADDGPRYVAPAYVQPGYAAPAYVAPAYVAPRYVEPAYVPAYQPYPYAHAWSHERDWRGYGWRANEWRERPHRDGWYGWNRD